MSKPNILLISVDDMNDWAGCLNGYPGVQTPNMDRLAQRGRLFTNAHCPSPLCNPSRTALLTGLAPHNSGVYGNGHWWRPARPNLISLPMHFKNNGYETVGAGKTFHHPPGFNPPDQWDEYFMQVFDDAWDRKLHPDITPTDPPTPHPLNGITPYEHEFDWGVLDITEEDYGDAKAIAWASDYLKRDHSKPFFLAVGTFRPHLPCYAPQKYFDQYPQGRIQLPPFLDTDIENLPPLGQKFAAARRNCYEKVIDHDQWEIAVQAYLACITFADAQIGRLLDALEQSGHANNTIIVFFSDNGFHLGEKQHWHKSTLWERATHVPFIISAPNITHPGQSSNRPVSLQDIYPTLIDLCDLPPRPNHPLDGESLLPLLTDPNAHWRESTLTTFQPGNHAVRTERWRYIRYVDGGEELYDRQEDPNEWHNLASYSDYKNIISDLQQCVPPNNAPEVPTKTDYDFDYENHTWTSKSP